ncbi:hypothetical protein SAMN05444747_11151 [Variovorax sp. OV329]|nr:hypothetical protein SAMN05444747_11151 [Variovorax sp. OV329]
MERGVWSAESLASSSIVSRWRGRVSIYSDAGDAAGTHRALAQVDGAPIAICVIDRLVKEDFLFEVEAVACGAT